MKQLKRWGLCLLAALVLAALPACAAKQPTESGAVSLLYLDGYVYFTFDGALYSETPDFDRQNRLAASGASSAFYYNGRIGYADAENGNALTVLLSNGANKEVLTKDAFAPLGTQSSVYAIAGEDRRIFRIDRDNGAKVELDAKNCVSFDVAGDSVYFSTGKALYQLDSKKKAAPKRLHQGGGIDLVFAGGKLRSDGSVPAQAPEWIYFVQRGKLFQIKPDGGEPQAVGDGLKGTQWRLSGADAFCVREGKLMRQPLKGGAATELAADCVAIAGAADGWAYFASETEGKQHFERIRLDGSAKRDVLV